MIERADQGPARVPSACRIARCRRVRRKLGPMPAAALRAMADYGLNDAEMASYFRLTPSSLRRARRALRVDEDL